MIRRSNLLTLVAALAAPALAHAAGDPAKGATVFKQRCGVCHVSAAGAAATMGPNLFGVVGRKAGSTAGFTYSDAIKASGLTWSATELDSFLTAPNKKVPGTRMFINVTNPADRADLIAFLATLKK
ncbi:MAG TPA: c-type cytochrome [Caulobacteraceae bacterium]|jgi:cytochrome c